MVPTQPVTIRIADFGGPAISGVLVSSRLSDFDYTSTDGTFVSTAPVEGETVAGEVVLQCFPNAVSPVGLGTRGTVAIFTWRVPGGKAVEVRAAVINAPCNLTDIQIAEAVGLDAAQLAVQQAQGERALAQQYKEAADLDAQATAADRVQVGIDRAVADDDVLQAQAALQSAIGQASLAQAAAASASSVPQQDLSGTAGLVAALHRSPNAPVDKPLIMRVWEDSDGGAWRKKCAHLSYTQEPLNGAWRGPIAGANIAAAETTVRAIAGAATGDYFQWSGNGKFYRLAAGAGVTETFLGNTPEFPAIPVAAPEAGRVVIYDAASPGRPMWRVLPAGATQSANSMLANGNINFVAYKEGKLYVAETGAGLFAVDFATDSVTNYLSNQVRRYVGNIAQGTQALGWMVLSSAGIASNTVNAISACTMPDAPVDPQTLLQVPTIAVATSGGGSLIQQDGSVASNTGIGNVHNVTLTPYAVTFSNSGSGTLNYALNPGRLTGAFAVSTISGANNQWSAFANAGVSAAGRSMIGRRSGTRFSRMRFNETNPLASIFNDITDTYNTGLMHGGTVRCLLADMVAGVANAGELVADRSYKAKHATVVGTLTRTLVGGVAMWGGWSPANYVQEAFSADLDATGGTLLVPFAFTIPANVSAPGWAVDRSGAAGAGWKIGHDATGKLAATVTNGTDTRTVTTTATYATGTVQIGALMVESSGTVSLWVGPTRVASTTGTPLGSLASAAATLTVGIDRSLTQPWAGQLALLDIGMTGASDDAMAWMYQQELQMFRPGAQVTLPDAGPLVRHGRDDDTGRWLTVSAANAAEFAGLVRVSSTPVPAGSYTSVDGAQGIRVMARTGANPGVDITMPAQNLREELQRRSEDARRLDARSIPLEWSATFTATTANGSTSMTAIANLSLPLGATLVGAQVTGGGLPAGTVIQSISGTTAQLSAPAGVGAGAGVTITILDYILPTGMEVADDVVANRLLQYEGATLDYTRPFDGFRERARFPTAAPPTGRVRINARRAATV